MKKRKQPLPALLGLYIFEDVGDRAVQYVAEGVKRCCGDGFALLHAVEGVCGQPMVEYKGIFRDSLAVERFRRRRGNICSTRRGRRMKEDAAACRRPP